MKIFLFIAVLSSAFLLSACGENKTTPADEAQELQTQGVEADKAVVLDGSQGLSPFGEMHPALSYDSLQTGDTVLTPSFNWIKDMYEKGPEAVNFIYYTARVVEVKKNSAILESFGENYEVANSLFIPIAKNQKAKVGDILLTWWQSGSGMQRAIVVGGTENEPVVRYLDMDYENPAKNSAGTPIAQADETLKPGSFFVLEEGLRAGNKVVVKSSNEVKHVVNVSGDSVLTLAWAGKFEHFMASDLEVLPNKVDLAVGDLIQAEHFGSLTNATVTSIDAKNGRVFADVTFAGSKKNIALALGEFKK